MTHSLVTSPSVVCVTSTAKKGVQLTSKPPNESKHESPICSHHCAHQLKEENKHSRSSADDSLNLGLVALVERLSWACKVVGFIPALKMVPLPSCCTKSNYPSVGLLKIFFFQIFRIGIRRLDQPMNPGCNTATAHQGMMVKCWEQIRHPLGCDYHFDYVYIHKVQ